MIRPVIESAVSTGRCLAAFDQGRLVATALYHDMRQWWHGNDALFVERMVASSAATTRALWAVAASNSSVAGTVRAQVGPSDPLWWMLREQDADIAERESWMLRLLDAPAAIAARGFPVTDIAVPLLITDDLRPANSGWWDLTVCSGRGSLTRSQTGQVHPPATPPT